MFTVFVKFTYLMSLAVWVGSMIFFSFIGAPSIFKILEKPMAGRVVGDIFPKYWIIGYICGAIALASLFYLWKKGSSGTTVIVTLLSIMLCTALYAGLCVGPRARNIKARITATENAEEKEDLRKRFSKIHRRSMEMNVTILIMGITVVFLTARNIKM